MKRIICSLMILCLIPLSAALAGQDAEEQLKKELGAFEITAYQREAAKTNEAGYSVLERGPELD